MDYRIAILHGLNLACCQRVLNRITFPILKGTLLFLKLHLSLLPSVALLHDPALGSNYLLFRKISQIWIRYFNRFCQLIPGSLFYIVLSVLFLARLGRFKRFCKAYAHSIALYFRLEL